MTWWVSSRARANIQYFDDNIPNMLHVHQRVIVHEDLEVGFYEPWRFARWSNLKLKVRKDLVNFSRYPETQENTMGDPSKGETLPERIGN